MCAVIPRRGTSYGTTYKLEVSTLNLKCRVRLSQFGALYVLCIFQRTFYYQTALGILLERITKFWRCTQWKLKGAKFTLEAYSIHFCSVNARFWSVNAKSVVLIDDRTMTLKDFPIVRHDMRYMHAIICSSLLRRIESALIHFKSACVQFRNALGTLSKCLECTIRM